MFSIAERQKLPSKYLKGVFYLSALGMPRRVQRAKILCRPLAKIAAGRPGPLFAATPKNEK
jgi:hypothetical protein